jgi:hypothetical protein
VEGEEVHQYMEEAHLEQKHPNLEDQEENQKKKFGYQKLS